MFSNFHGSVDDLLNHCAKADVDEVARVTAGGDRPLTDREAIDMIVEDFHIGEEEAKKMLHEIKMEEVMEICQSLLDKGLIELTGYDAKGLPLYKLKST